MQKTIRIPQHPWEIPPGSRLVVKKVRTIEIWRCVLCHKLYNFKPFASGEKLYSDYCIKPECGGRLKPAKIRD